MKKEEENKESIKENYYTMIQEMNDRGIELKEILNEKNIDSKYFNKVYKKLDDIDYPNKELFKKYIGLEVK